MKNDLHNGLLIAWLNESAKSLPHEASPAKIAVVASYLISVYKCPVELARKALEAALSYNELHEALDGNDEMVSLLLTGKTNKRMN